MVVVFCLFCTKERKLKKVVLKKTTFRRPLNSLGSIESHWICDKLKTWLYAQHLSQGVSETDSEVGVIPANTQLQTALSVRSATEAQKAHVELSISTPNGMCRFPQVLQSRARWTRAESERGGNAASYVGAEVQYIKIRKQPYMI